MSKLLLLLLLLLLPSQLSIHFWPSWSFINGIRVDYLSPTLYLTDIIIILLWCNNRQRLKIPAYLLFLITLNIFFSVSPFVTIYKWLRVYEYYWLFKYLVKIENLKHIIKWPLTMAIVWTSVLAWLQFIHQGSMGGLWYWLGERTFNVSTPGIAKVELWFMNHELWLRPYATFGHPNALAGWLLIAALLVGGWIWTLTIPTLFITFSRTIIFGLIGPLVLFFPGNPASLSERIEQMKMAVTTIQHYPLFGTGLGNFLTANQVLQPVHNIYLLLISELGIPLFSILSLLIIRSFKQGSWKLIIILLIGLLDHYWVTLHQNILLLVVLLANVYQDILRRRIPR